MAKTIGVLLAAGAGRRMGQPKALVRDADDVPWVVSASRALAEGGCFETMVVIGAAAAEVRTLLAGERVTIVEAPDWETGMGASLRDGLRALAYTPAEAALIHLVDLPDVGPDVIERLLAEAAPDALVRASYDGRPGHPVLIGREHWPALADEVTGDKGARDYLDRNRAIDLDCSDLASGLDVDDIESMLGS